MSIVTLSCGHIWSSKHLIRSYGGVLGAGQLGLDGPFQGIPVV